MISIQDIEGEIQRLENAEVTYQNCSKLAVLYSIQDHLQKKPNKMAEYSFGGSEFLSAVAGASIDDVFQILDEHMECVKVLYPKEYTAIIQRIKRLD